MTLAVRYTILVVIDIDANVDFVDGIADDLSGEKIAKRTKEWSREVKRDWCDLKRGCVTLRQN